MGIASKPQRKLLLLGAGLMSLGACATSAPTAISADHLEGSALSRNEIGVSKRTEFLEVSIDPAASELNEADRARIRNFVGSYAQKGHGPLVLSLPAASANPQFAVTAVAEARTIAWEKGIRYDEIEGSAHGAGAANSQPMILAYQAYEAVAPECLSKAALDFSDVASNNNLPTLGCSVRTNLAAMIADPADLLGNRPMEAGDAGRREVIMDKFRKGETTASVRTAQESGAVSRIVN
ncbi:MAG: CpaD family pilus assembly protein [Hyphomonas sp.]|uniref:CpaD family pilus assembly protein n=1 Tax=Hyphomonas sp. TaxID=87 RepID=UPI00349FFF12